MSCAQSFFTEAGESAADPGVRPAACGIQWIPGWVKLVLPEIPVSYNGSWDKDGGMSENAKLCFMHWQNSISKVLIANPLKPEYSWGWAPWVYLARVCLQSIHPVHWSRKLWSGDGARWDHWGRVPRLAFLQVALCCHAQRFSSAQQFLVAQ